MKRLSRFLIFLLTSTFFFSCSSGDIEVDLIPGFVKVVDDISNVTITDVEEDTEGFLWISTTANGVFRFDGSSYIQFVSDPSEPKSLSSSYVSDILIDRNGGIWFATQRGIDKYQGDFSFTHYINTETNNYCTSIIENNEGQIFALTRMAVLVYNPETSTFRSCFKHSRLSNSEPSIRFDKSGHLWIKYDNELICYDESLTQIASIKFQSPQIQWAFDEENLLFVESNNKLHFIDTYRLEEVEPLRYLLGLSKEYVFTLTNVNKDLILIRSNMNSYCYDCKSRVLYNGESENNPYSTVISVVSNKYIYDKNGDFWTINSSGLVFHKTEHDPYVGKVHLDNFLREHFTQASATDGNFVWYYSSDGYLLTYDRGAKKLISRYNFYEQSRESIFLPKLSYSPDGYLLLSSNSRNLKKAYLFDVSDNGIPKLLTTYHGNGSVVATFDGDGNVWFGGIGCFYKSSKPYNKTKDVVLESIPLAEHQNLSYANFVLNLHNGSILFLYSDLLPFVVDTKTGKITSIEVSENLSQVYYMSSLEDASGRLWLGTSDHGLFVKMPSSDHFEHVKETGQSIINSILQDKEGNVFVLENNSVVYFIKKGDPTLNVIWRDASDLPESKTLITMPDRSIRLLVHDNLIPLSFEDSSNSLPVEYPLSVVISASKNPVATFISSKMKNNKITVDLGDIKSSLFLRLAVLGQAFGTDVYNYHYVVNGNKSKLVGSLNNPVIPLQNLKNGRNVIHFMITNDSTMQYSPVYTIVLRTSLPLGTLFSIIAFIIISIVALVLYYIQRAKKAEAENERKRRELQEEINVKNIDFFANVSHEFRTPLTIINGATGVLESETSSRNEKDSAMGVIRRNTARMLKLVSQMLDFNKLDHDMLKLSVKMEDISSVINQVVDNFKVGANVKNIDLIVDGCDLPVLGIIDADKLEKILYNLLSNAFKFTPPGGSIVVSAKFDDNLTVKVSDSGIGLLEDKIDTLFDRFTQINPSKKTGGTGIGLYYCKALAELHHGSISAANRYENGSDGKSLGSVFTVVIPIGENDYTEGEKTPREDTNVSIDKTDYNEEIVASADIIDTDEEAKPTIVIVDDDYEIVHFLKNLFSPHYNVVYRFDAMSGYSKIQETHPDIIISDYMMLDMDGLELCRMVKDNIEITHIPFIMLTAKSSLQDQLDGFNSGADAFVSKPFNPEYLLALVKSQLDNRIRMKKMLSVSVSTPVEGDNNTGKKLSAMDKEFMDTVYGIMEKNLEDGQLDIDQVAEMIGVSRSKFYYKLKALTGQTPNEFFTTYKLNRAKELLEEGRYKISAIANIVGFNSGSHFANLFKKKFGILPSQYQEENIRPK